MVTTISRCRNTESFAVAQRPRNPYAGALGVSTPARKSVRREQAVVSKFPGYRSVFSGSFCGVHQFVRALKRMMQRFS